MKIFHNAKKIENISLIRNKIAKKEKDLYRLAISNDFDIIFIFDNFGYPYKSREIYNSEINYIHLLKMDFEEIKCCKKFLKLISEYYGI